MPPRRLVSDRRPAGLRALAANPAEKRRPAGPFSVGRATSKRRLGKAMMLPATPCRYAVKPSKSILNRLSKSRANSATQIARSIAHVCLAAAINRTG